MFGQRQMAIIKLRLLIVRFYVVTAMNTWIDCVYVWWANFLPALNTNFTCTDTVLYRYIQTAFANAYKSSFPFCVCV